MVTSHSGGGRQGNRGPSPAGGPLYRQVREALERRVLSGSFADGQRLPSSRELSAELGISRNTVNTAYQELIAEGFLVARPRQGLYVNEEISLSSVAEHSRLLPSKGVDWQRRLGTEPDSWLPEIDKIDDWHDRPYPFIAGQVDTASFPAAAWLRALREALYPPHLHHSLRDAIATDDPLLVDVLCRRILPARGILDVQPSEVLATMGSQQALHYLSTSLVTPGMAVAVEDPGYLDARHIFVRAGATLVPLSVDQSGVIPPRTLDGVGLLYVTPSHQHPTNVTLSIGRRHQLLDLARRADALILEDDYDSELRYQGRPSPALKSLDTSGRVIYMGTFSKFLAPGLRLGYLVGPRELIEALRRERRYSIRHPPGHMQRAMALFIESGQYQRAVRRHRAQLRHKWEAMSDAIGRHFPWPVALPPGGVTVWINGPAGLDAASVVNDALNEGIIIERGDVFHLQPEEGRACFRLGYSAIPSKLIEPGIQRLGQVLRRQRISTPASPPPRLSPETGGR